MNKSSNISSMLRAAIIFSSLSFAIGYTSIANSAGGCGHGWHRNDFGNCVLNAPGPFARPAPYHNGCWRNEYGQLRCYRWGY